MRIRPAALIIENNHVLFLRYDYPGGSKFALPGGNVDAGETFPVCIARECEEELGIEVEVGDLRRLIFPLVRTWFLKEISWEEFRNCIRMKRLQMI
jgi:8-oxo-dGTP pyrophosphatase MutT (NUDIX family)